MWCWRLLVFLCCIEWLFVWSGDCISCCWLEWCFLLFVCIVVLIWFVWLDWVFVKDWLGLWSVLFGCVGLVIGLIVDVWVWRCFCSGDWWLGCLIVLWRFWWLILDCLSVWLLCEVVFLLWCNFFVRLFWKCLGSVNVIVLLGLVVVFYDGFVLDVLWIGCGCEFVGVWFYWGKCWGGELLF